MSTVHWIKEKHPVSILLGGCGKARTLLVRKPASAALLQPPVRAAGSNSGCAKNTLVQA